MKFIFILLIFLFVPISVYADCTCETDSEGKDRAQSLKLKVIAIVTILVGSAIGVTLPVLGKILPALGPEKDLFVIIKAFAAGVILATGFIHVLPDAFESLTSPCLNENPWGNFPFAGFTAMLSAMATLIVDSFATGYYNRLHSAPGKVVEGDEEKDGAHEGHMHVHTHATQGHAHGSGFGLQKNHSSELLRNRVISQVLELGIVVHSVIIGISLGASQSVGTIKPLVISLTFHQFFEGMGLGSCISQAKFKARAVTIMAIFFTLTTPIGIAIGFGISNIYKENSPKALIFEGLFDAASSGILVYMALVDLLAADFMSARLQNNLKLQLGAKLSLLVGAGCMSLLAKWA